MRSRIALFVAPLLLLLLSMLPGAVTAAPPSDALAADTGSLNRSTVRVILP